MRRILSVLLENESGALSRVIGLFSQRGYNIESLTVAPTDDPTLSRMTIQTVGDEKVLDANNAFGLILNPEFQKYKDCYVKDIKAMHQRIVIITIETPEEREVTERIDKFWNSLKK